MARVKIDETILEDAALTMSGGRLCLRWAADAWDGTLDSAADAWDGTLDSAAELLGVASELREVDADKMTVALYAMRGLASLRMENRFLLGAGSGYAAGATGGEAEHTLTGNEMPSHYHLLAMNQAGESEYWGPMCAAMQDGYMVNMTKPAGGDQPHNNMPPYIAVYMWRRTA